MLFYRERDVQPFIRGPHAFVAFSLALSDFFSPALAVAFVVFIRMLTKTFLDFVFAVGIESLSVLSVIIGVALGLSQGFAHADFSWTWRAR